MAIKQKKYKLIHGDCLQVMKDFADNSIDTIITDPPYGLSFMDKKWDYNIPSIDIWKECLRVLKPGGHLLSFGGTRTWHRIAVSIEDAGFEIRDSIMWLYGSGFPKSVDISKAIDKDAGAERKVVGIKQNTYDGAHRNPEKHKSPAELSSIGKWGLNQTPHGMPETEASTKLAKQWEGWGTALKPAVEPIIVAMKPLDGTYVENAQKHSVAGLNIDGSRIKKQDGDRTEYGLDGIPRKTGLIYGKQYGINQFDGKEGRWPANIIHDGSDEIVKVFPQTTSGAMKRDVPGYEGTSNTNFIRGKSGPSNQHGDSGSASRFFYCAKASREERELGLKNFESKKRDMSRKEGNPGGDNPRNRGVHKIKNNHPTVKPLSLMRYLCKLTKTPSGGVVLDPFMGSGTTGIACFFEGRDFIGIELEKEYFDLASSRIGHAEELRWEYEEISKKEEETINNKADQFFEFE